MQVEEGRPWFDKQAQVFVSSVPEKGLLMTSRITPVFPLWVKAMRRDNGIKMQIAEKGEGPLVALCHGFPESW